MNDLLRLLEPICYKYIPFIGDFVTIYGATEHVLASGWIAEVQQNKVFATLIINTGQTHLSFTYPFLLNEENGIIIVVED